MSAGEQFREHLRLERARAIELLCRALRDHNWEVRRHAAETLGAIGDDRAVEPLCESLEDKNWEVRRFAAQALVRLADARAVEPLCRALQDEYPLVRCRAAEALLQLGDSRALDALCAALNDTSCAVVQYAAAALGKMADARAVKPLCGLLEDGLQVRLTNIAGAPYLHARPSMEDERTQVRCAAASALGEIGRREALGALRACLLANAGQVMVQESVRAAIARIEESIESTATLPVPAGVTLDNTDTLPRTVATADIAQDKLPRVVTID